MRAHCQTFSARKQPTIPWSLRLAGNAGGLMLSGAALAAALEWRTAGALAWVALLPFFLAIRLLRPADAALGGAWWGLTVLVCCGAGESTRIPADPQAIALMTALPAAYAGVGALLTRRVGFSPLLLALGWALLELALQPLGMRLGLLGNIQDDSPYLHWIASVLGSAFVAFLVAGVNATLLELLSTAGNEPAVLPARIRVPLSWRLLATPFVRQLLAHDAGQGYPRAPPA